MFGWKRGMRPVSAGFADEAPLAVADGASDAEPCDAAEGGAAAGAGLWGSCGTALDDALALAFGALAGALEGASCALDVGADRSAA